MTKDVAKDEFDKAVDKAAKINADLAKADYPSRLMPRRQGDGVVWDIVRDVVLFANIDVDEFEKARR